MYIFYYAVLIILPTRSWSFSCQYNETSTISRQAILLELEDHNYIQIRDALCDIKLKNETMDIELTPRKKLQFIKSIQFRGYLVEGGVSEYIETAFTTLVGYRYWKTGNACRVSYQETKSGALNLTIGQETAILRLAQSCIQSKVCDIDLMKIDRDTDLYYQSIQSSINELVDFYVPKVLDSVLEYGQIITLPTIDVKKGDISLYAKNGFILGLDAVQRVSDVVIKPESSKIVVEFKLRFPKLYGILTDISAEYKMMFIYGNTIIEIEGASFKVNIYLDIRESSCSVGLSNVGEFAFKHITFDVPLWGFRLFSYKFDSKKLYEFEKEFLNNTIRQGQFDFDCKKDIGKFAEVLGTVIDSSGVIH